MQIGLRGWLRFLGECAIAAACITALSAGLNGWRGWPRLAGGFGFNFLYCVEIGGLAWLLAPLVAHRTWKWHAFTRWSVQLLTLFVVGVAGTFVATAVAQILAVWGWRTGGPFATDLSFERAYWRVLQAAVPITLFIGVMTTVLEQSKGRLRATELALRTQQAERERAEKLAAEAQLASLASRVQPHFLFNTLNSIAALIREDPARAEQMVERLGALLRSSLDGARTVPLQHEMRLVTDYLEIQRARLGSRLNYSIDCPEETIDDATVPPFAIQTIVENAIKHVAGQRQQGVSLHLTARRADTDLLIEVTDNGTGFDLGALKAGHGLDSLQGRLQALYGERAALELDRASDGMTVRLRLPT
jgi:hypothetical protein